MSTQSLVPKSVLDGFWRLSDTREKARLEAVAKIVNCGHNDEYVLTRLVRGLASNREFARKGFFVTLVEMIRNNNEDDIVEKVLQLADSVLKVKGATKGVSMWKQLLHFKMSAQSLYISGNLLSKEVRE